ncbi:MAG: preprotein translocase subunit Sec61beta [archaeon]
MKGIKSESYTAPASSAGILRFFETGGGGLKIKPLSVIILASVVIILEILFKFI